MPKRRVLFGIGVGIVITCMAFYFIYTQKQTEPDGEVTDDYIISQAEALGMTFAAQATPTPEPTMSPSPAPIPTPAPTPAPEPTPEPYTEPTAPTAQPTQEPMQSPVPEDVSEPETETETEPEPITEPTPSPSPKETPSSSYNEATGTVRVKIPDGYTASDIAQLLKKAGVIESADDFIQLLREKNYTMKMASGTFNLVPGTDYETLAETLVRKVNGR